MPTDKPRELRQLAELADRPLTGQFAGSELGLPPEQVPQLLHELRVHQIELELQNEQLRSAQLSLEFERSRYFDLYDLAPVAYCSLSDKGLIRQANLAAAGLFGLGRQALLDQAFIRFIQASDRHAYHQHCQRLIASTQAQTSQLRMLKHDGQPFWAQLVSSLQQTPDGALQQRVVISDVSEQKRLSQAQRKAELAGSLLLAQEQFKQRFSHELHDRTSANLAALRLNLEWLVGTAAHSRNTQQFSDCVADTWAVLEDTNNGIRDLCADLYPSVFELGGLAAALQSYAQSLRQRAGLVVDISCGQDRLGLPADMALALFRITQEALTNCVKHARASRITVSLQLEQWPLSLCIEDDGAGFDLRVIQLSQTRPPVPGQGLRQMQHVAEFLNGSFRLDSFPGQGTRIRVDIPHPGWAPAP